MLSIVVIAYLEIKAVVTDNIFHIVIIHQSVMDYQKRKILGRDFILSIDCSVRYWYMDIAFKSEGRKGYVTREPEGLVIFMKYIYEGNAAQLDH